MGAFQEYITTRRSESTKKTYSEFIGRIIPDPDGFLTLARTDKRAAEDRLIGYILSRKGQIAGSTFTVGLSMVKSFLDFNDVSLNWKRVKQVAPVGRMVAVDRAPTHEEVRLFLKAASTRERVAALFMASGGLRVGALPGLTLADYAKLESGVGRLRVYAGEPEQYSAFVSKEAVAELESYLEERRQAGESLTPRSPMFRDVWNFEGGGKAIAPQVAHRLTGRAFEVKMLRTWRRVGIRRVGVKAEFKPSHGFRKFFRTQGSRSMSREDVEVLMGHFLSYYKPTLERLEEEYLKAEPFLTVAESLKLKQEIAAKDKEHESKWDKVQLDNLRMDKEIRDMKDQMERMDRLLREPDLLEAMRKHSKQSQ